MQAIDFLGGGKCRGVGEKGADDSLVMNSPKRERDARKKVAGWKSLSYFVC